jgi:hypothetical protein
MIDELVKDHRIHRQYKFKIQKCFHNINTLPTNQVNFYWNLPLSLTGKDSMQSYKVFSLRFYANEKITNQQN